MVERIKSSQTTLSVLALCLLSQVPHAQHVFYSLSHSDTWVSWLLALVFAIALEAAVMVFVLHGWHAFSYAFAASSVLINISYYGMLPPVVVKLLLAVTLPLAIACYSHLLSGDSGGAGIVNAIKGMLTASDQQSSTPDILRAAIDAYVAAHGRLNLSAVARETGYSRQTIAKYAQQGKLGGEL